MSVNCHFSLVESQATTGRNAAYFQALAFNKDLGATRGIDAALKKFDLDALVLPAPGFTAIPAAIAGYPIVTGTVAILKNVLATESYSS
jgi:amidase